MTARTKRVAVGAIAALAVAGLGGTAQAATYKGTTPFSWSGGNALGLNVHNITSCPHDDAYRRCDNGIITAATGGTIRFDMLMGDAMATTPTVELGDLGSVTAAVGVDFDLYVFKGEKWSSAGYLDPDDSPSDNIKGDTGAIAGVDEWLEAPATAGEKFYFEIIYYTTQPGDTYQASARMK